MVREELVNSAVSFLQDPSVAGAPIEKRIAFLQSKNLTQDEINVSLARAGELGAATAAAAPPPLPPPMPQQQQQGYAYPPPPGYGQYPGPGGYWQQPPPELPHRDWRDWFIMATVMGGVTFGLYETFKRYILPLLAPPTPAQLTTDKAAIDASFDRAFAALSALETDTKALKGAEEARTARLDAALADLEAALERLKEADRARDDDARRNADEMRRLADALAKGLEGQKAATENRVRDLTSEVRSLKTLVAARVGGPSGAVAAAATPAVAGTAATTAGAAATPAATNGEAKSPAPAAAAANGTAATTANAGTSTTPPAAAPQPQAFPRFGSGKPAAIPAWQMAAAKKASQETLRDEAAQAARAAAKREDAERGLQAQVEEEGEAVSGAA